MKLEGPQQAELRELLADLFNISELQDLCLNLNINYEELTGDRRTDKTRDLISMMDRHGRIEELLKEVQAMRPKIDWQDVAPHVSRLAFPLSHHISRPHNFANDEQLTEVLWEHRDHDLIKDYIDLCFKKDRDLFRKYLDLDEVNLRELFKNSGLQKSSPAGKAILTQAGVLLFCKRNKFPKNIYFTHVKLQRIKGLEIVGRKDYWGSVIYLYNEIFENWLKPECKKSVGYADIRDERGAESYFYEYPEVAIIEAFVNFLIHRDYLSDDQGYIRIHNNKIEFINPGLSLISPIELLEASEQQMPKYYRNPRLIEAMNMTGLNQREGGGILRIKQVLEKNQSYKENGELGLEIENDEEKNRFVLRIFKKFLDFEEAQETRHYLVPPAAELTFPIHQIAYLQNHNFVGRESILNQLAEKLKAGQTTVVTQTIAGLGGVGKTQLALAYCYANLDAYDLIYWLSANNELALGDSMMGLARCLNLVSPDTTDQEEARQATLYWLSQATRRWLLVYDNADLLEPRQLANYLPRTGNGDVIITSRNPNWHSVGSVLELDVFSEVEAVAFLTRRARNAMPETKVVNSLAEALGYFPLALEHAAAYVEATGSSYAIYQKLFETVRQDLWQEAEAPNSYYATIATTWDLAFKQIRLVPGSLELLNLCCLLAPNEIPFDLIVEHAKIFPNELAEVLSHPLNRDKAVSSLIRYSLIQRRGNDLNIHHLVQIMARDYMTEEMTQHWAEAAILFLSVAFVYDENNIGTWAESQRLLNHNQAIVDWPSKYLVLPREIVQLLNKTAEYFRQFGNYQPSIICTKKALTISEEQLGPDHPDTAQSLNNLGGLLQDMGDLAAARPYLERALAIREKSLGKDHPNTAESLNNLGSLLQDMGDLVAARSFYERAQAIWEKVLGSDHPDTASSLNNLGGLLQDMGDLIAARSYYERALAIWEKALGPDHPDTASSLNNLGGLLQDMGDLAAARPYYERALTIDEEVLGPDHPDTASSLNNLGGLLQDMGDLAAARPYYERALAIYEKALGPDHPDTASSLTNLGAFLQDMGDLSAAQPYFERALTIQEKAFGPDHPDIAYTLNNLGGLHALQGEIVLARSYLERALTITEQAKGENHPFLVKILANLGGILVILGQLTLARRHLNRARAICREAPKPYAECLEAEEYWNRLPGKIGKPKKNRKKRRR